MLQENLEAIEAKKTSDFQKRKRKMKKNEEISRKMKKHEENENERNVKKEKIAKHLKLSMVFGFARKILDDTRMLQRLGGSRAITHWNDARDNMSGESFSPSMACDVGEVCSESSRKMRDKEETTSEASWTAVITGKRKRGVEA